jgi:hypothetical protein
VTEAEWLAADVDAYRIGQKIDFVFRRFSERKFQLFRLACCRQIWHLLTHDSYRDAVETAERLVEGHATREEQESALARAEVALAEIVAARAARPAATPVPDNEVGEIRAARAALCAARADYEYESFPNTASFASAIVQLTVSAAVWSSAVAATRPDGSSLPAITWQDAYTRAHATHARLVGVLLLDIFGNPFRAPPVVNREPFRSRIARARQLAEAIYEERAFHWSRRLADALEDAGCSDGDLLGHLRSPGPHVRGCWAVDLVLGKE